MDPQRGGVLSRNMAKLEAKVRKTRIHALPTNQEVRWLYVNHLASFFFPQRLLFLLSLFCFFFGKSLSRPNECSELQAPHFASPSSPVDPSNSTHPDPSRNMHPSRDVDALDHGYPNDAETPLMSQRLKVMSQLPLKDRLAPLVLQNANLRSAYDQHDLHEANHNQGRPSISDKNVDSALTPDVCESIASSLIATVMQLKEMEPMPCLVPYTNSPVHSKQTEGTTPSLTNSPLTPSSGQNTTSSQAMPSTPLRFPTRSAPNSGPQGLQATVHQKDVHTSTGTNGASTNSTSPRAYQASSVAQPKHQEQSAISIPIPAAYFNNASFSQTPNLPSRPPSDLTPHEYIKRPGDRTGPSWKQPSSPNERPQKRPWSRSPPASPSTWHYKNNDRRLGRDTFSPSPPPPRLARSPPTSPSYHRRHQPPPFIPRRSRSPRSRRSPSPRRSRSPPRRRESFYSSSAPRQSTSLYHHGSSPVSRSTREYEYSRIPRERETSISSSPTGVTSGGGGLPNSSKTPRGPYLTKYEREQYLASLRRDDEEEGHRHTRRRSNAWENDDPQRQHNRMAVDQITVGDELVTGRQIRAKTRSFQTALPTPPASATSTVDHIMELEQAAYTSDPRPKSVLGLVQASAKGPLQQETLNVNAELDRARTHANNPFEREKTLPPWQPLNNIPGIWLLNEGLGEADIFEHSFDVTKEMALKWHLPLLKGDFVKSVLSDKEPRSKFIRKSLPTVSWKLKCVPLEAVNTVRHTLENPITASELVHQLVQLQSCWPSEGKLLIEVNPGQDIGKTFYAKHLVNKSYSLFYGHWLNETF